MSRSYRKPYASFCGSKSSAKEDKQTAARGVRHVQNYVAKLMLSDPDILMPHRLECPWNNTYSWSRDGGKKLRVPKARHWDTHVKAVLGISDWSWGKERDLVWPPEWYVKMLRK